MFISESWALNSSTARFQLWGEFGEEDRSVLAVAGQQYVLRIADVGQRCGQMSSLAYSDEVDAQAELFECCSYRLGPVVDADEEDLCPVRCAILDRAATRTR